MKRLLLGLVSLLGISPGLLANNIQVANISLNGQNTTSHFSLVNFDISWENSWRTSTNESNHDGAWIFVKYRKTNTSDWRHATLSLTGHTQPAGSVIQVSSDGKGAWMYRAANGQGTVAWNTAKVQWNYGQDGVNDNDSVEIRVFAIEMTYIPTGAYYLGSGGASIGEFRTGGPGTSTPYLVSSAAAITVANTAANLYYENQNFSAGDQTGPIPASYPNGYQGFWLMKYEASQQQVVDFLNHLDAAKATANNPGNFTGSHPALAAPQPERACPVSWKILAAYADWSGMRPYTELEFEKACRGANIAPVAHEYAWGNTTLAGLTAVTNTGTPNEAVDQPANANCHYMNSYSMPVRCGIFATATSNRSAAGAGYYGNMELSGNLWEYVVSAGNADGRAFNGSHGDGMLNSAGAANVNSWPVSSGYVQRGGSILMSSTPELLRVSNRTFGGATNVATTVGQFAIRLARTAE
jgi:hypothetical protein